MCAFANMNVSFILHSTRAMTYTMSTSVHCFASFGSGGGWATWKSTSTAALAAHTPMKRPKAVRVNQFVTASILVDVVVQSKARQISRLVYLLSIYTGERHAGSGSVGGICLKIMSSRRIVNPWTRLSGFEKVTVGAKPSKRPASCIVSSWSIPTILLATVPA